MDSRLDIPFLNPVKFYKVNRSNISTFYTKHFDDYPFAERLLPWNQATDYIRLWQTTDIIPLQFESSFDPIIVKLINQSSGKTESELPALIGLPNKYDPNKYAFEVNMSLATVPEGCYKLLIEAGSGVETEYYESAKMYISASQYSFPTLLIKYWSNRFHGDVMFESGIKFQFRIAGHVGKLKTGREESRFRDQRFNPYILNSKPFRQFQIVFGDEYGLPDDIYDLLNWIFSCQNVEIDNKPFSAYDAEEFEVAEPSDINYPKRGFRIYATEGINRASSIFIQNTDTTKKLVYGIMVSKKVFGDTANQGSDNTVPLFTVE